MSIKFENTEVLGWEQAVRGMRNPMNSWEKSDSGYCGGRGKRCDTCPYNPGDYEPCYFAQKYKDTLYVVGRKDLDLMKRLRNAGTDHRKFMRMITVYVDITAPLYWWKEFDTYKVGTVANSCSTMHKIADKEFTLEDFSCEHLLPEALSFFSKTVKELNYWRDVYLKAKTMDTPKPTVKDIWWQMIQLLPSSYNQKRTVMMNYEVLANIYKSRRNHKLDEWAEHKAEMIDVTTSEDLVNGDHRAHLVEGAKEYFGFCDWIKTLPYSELITGTSLSDIPITNEIMEEAERRVGSLNDQPKCRECIYFQKVNEVGGKCRKFGVPVFIDGFCKG